MYTLDTDFLIIGGGIIGTSAAYILSKLGKSVILAEKESIGSGSTGLSAGTIFCAGKGNINELNFNMKTRELLLELQETKGLNCNWRQTGALQIATTLEEKAFLKNKFHHFITKGHRHLNFLDASQVKKIEPNLSNVIAAIHSPLSGHVDPMETTHAFAEAAKEHGATIIENAKALKISQNENKTYTTYFKDLEINSKAVVLATGFSAFNLLKNFKDHIVPEVIPVKGQIWKTDAQDVTLNNVIFTCGSHLFWSKNKTTPSNCTHQNGIQLTDHAYGKQNTNGTIIFGGDRIPTTENDYSEDLNSLKRNQKYVTSFLPKIKTDNFSYWTGIMPFMMRKPFCQQIHPKLYPNIWFLGGFGPHGMMEGPGCVYQTFFENK